MILALYRHRGAHLDLLLEVPGTELDFARLDAAAAAKWGSDLVRIASWISAAPAAP